MNMKSRKKLIQTGLKLDVKPISDRGMTEEEYMAKVAELKKEAEIRKQQEAQETLNKVAAVSYTHLTLPTICSV